MIDLNSKLESFKLLEEDWDSYGAKKIDHSAINLTISMIPKLLIQGATNISVFPVPNGSVQLEFNAPDGSEVELCIEKEGYSSMTKYLNMDKLDLLELKI